MGNQGLSWWKFGTVSWFRLLFLHVGLSLLTHVVRSQHHSVLSTSAFPPVCCLFLSVLSTSLCFFSVIYHPVHLCCLPVVLLCSLPVPLLCCLIVLLLCCLPPSPLSVLSSSLIFHCFLLPCTILARSPVLPPCSPSALSTASFSSCVPSLFSTCIVYFAVFLLYCLLQPPVMWRYNFRVTETRSISITIVTHCFALAPVALACVCTVQYERERSDKLCCCQIAPRSMHGNKSQYNRFVYISLFPPAALNNL